MNKFKIGDAVTLKARIWRMEGHRGNIRTHRQATVITEFLHEIKGGVVLAEYLLGFRCWNVQDLVHWKLKRKKK